ncbi:hypothetical protein Agub_g1065, partial [Astrephomene gubernaculifera]
MEPQGPLRGAQPLVDLQKLFADVFDNALSDFVQLSQPGPADRESADQRKQRLLSHLHGTRQSLLRCLVLLQWKPWRVLSELVDHERLLDIAAGHVRVLGEVVGGMRQQAAGRIMAGAYLNSSDVNTALEVLTTGTYQELPSIILHRPPLFQPPPASLARQRSRLAHVTQLIRARLVQVSLPPGLKVVSISSGTAVLRAEGLYEAKLTLVPSEPLPGLQEEDAAAGGGGGGGGGAGLRAGGGEDADGADGWAAAAAAAAADPVAAAAASQRWKWRLIHFVLCIGVPFYDPRQPGQILNTCNFHMVLAADNAAYLRRQRMGAAGGGKNAPAAGAAAAAPSTLSESAATPAASGLPGSAAALGSTTAGGGGSLAAAVRRAEDDEVGAPLAVMHAILTDVAGRLLADELAAAARALAAPGSRWHGHISVKPSQLLHPGVRIEYWINAPPLLSQGALPVPGPGEDFRGVKPGPPYLELGMGEGGCVEVLHSPCSLHKPVAVSKLQLDTFRVNVEEVLMRAANMCAQSQLLQVRKELVALLVKALGRRAPTLRPTTLARQLWCRDGAALQPSAPAALGPPPPAAQLPLLLPEEAAAAAAAPGNGEPPPQDAATTLAHMDVDEPAAAAAAPQPPPQPAAPAAEPLIPPPSCPPPEVSGLLARAGPPEEAAGALVVLNAPVLECLVAGTTELKLGKHLFSGRLTLRPGQDERDEGSLDHAAAVAMDEDFVNQVAAAAYSSASPDTYPAARALREAARALSQVLLRVHNSTDVTHFFQAARRASLHISRLPRGMLEAFAGSHPGLAIEPRPRDKVATWALQSPPFPPHFPPLEPVPPDTPPLRVPQCLAFLLQSRLSLTSSHVMVVAACNKQLMPVKVLSCIPVPSSAYLLPDEVVAAYRAACSHGHSTSHAGNNSHTHNSSSGGGGTGSSYGSGLHHLHQHPQQQQHNPHSVHSVLYSGASSPRPTGHSQDHWMLRSPDASPTRDSSAGMAAATATTTTGCGAGNPSHPSAASPSPQQPAAFTPGKPTSLSGAAPQHNGSSSNSPGSGAGATHHVGRPTGQLVAVMLAQQQLSSVVRWCRRRMVWEVLLVQLGALGAAYTEQSHPPCQRLRVTRLAGMSLPCAIARRPGVSPARVGPVCLELELGPDALAGQVTARLYGTFLCSPTCVPVEPSSGGGGKSGATAGFVLDMHATSRVSSASSRGGSGGPVCLRRQYCLERGDSALTIVQEVCAIIRVQTLLARLEMMAPDVLVAVPTAAKAAAGAAGTDADGAGGVLSVGAAGAGAGGRSGHCLRPQHLTALTASLAGAACALGPTPPQRHHPTAASNPTAPPHGAGALPYGGGEGSYARGGGPPAKRIKTEPGAAEEVAVGANGYGKENGGGWPAAGCHPGGSHTGLANGFPGGGAPVSCVGNGSAVAAGSGGSGGGLAAPAHMCGGGASAPHHPAAAAGPGGLSWHWPLVGSLTLEQYSCSAATLRFSPCSSSSGGGGVPRGDPAASRPLLPHAHSRHQPPPQQQQQLQSDGGVRCPGGSDAREASDVLQVRVTWAPRDVRHLYGTATAAAATAPASPPQSPTSVGGGTPAMAGVAPTPALPGSPPAPSPLPVGGGYAAPSPPAREGPTSSSSSGAGRLGDVVRCSLSSSSGGSSSGG